MLSALVRANRALLVAATAALGVGASRIAGNPNNASDWLLTVGAALLLYASDICREVDDVARTFPATTAALRTQARVDVLLARGRHAIVLIALGVVLGGAGLVLALRN